MSCWELVDDEQRGLVRFLHFHNHASRHALPRLLCVVDVVAKPDLELIETDVLDVAPQELHQLAGGRPDAQDQLAKLALLKQGRNQCSGKTLRLVDVLGLNIHGHIAGLRLLEQVAHDAGLPEAPGSHQEDVVALKLLPYVADEVVAAQQLLRLRDAARQAAPRTFQGLHVPVLFPRQQICCSSAAR